MNAGSLAALIPVGTAPFIRRRASELSGLALVAASVLLAVALISFSASDPSLNHASAGNATNVLGWWGASAADVGLNAVGLAVVAPMLAIAFWGWRLIRKRPVTRGTLRVLALVSGAGCLAIALNDLPVPESWPLAVGLGGVGGSLLWSNLSVLTAAGEGLSGVVASAAGALGLALWAASFGLSTGEWARLGSLAARAALVPLGLASLLRRAGGVIRFPWSRFPPAGDGARRAVSNPAREPGARERPGQDGADLVAPATSHVVSGRRSEVTRQRQFDFENARGDHVPPLELLRPAPRGAGADSINREGLEQNARLLSTVLEDFGVRGEIVKVRPGPVITLYELEPAPGTKTSRVIGLADDIARSMSAVSVRVAVVPGRNVIGIELPNLRRETVYLRELLASDAFERSRSPLTLALGKDIGGSPVLVDLSRMPHLLIAGTTGSGKSVSINTLILSLLYQLPAETCKFILIDPKMLELSVYDGIPHLLAPVVTDPSKAVVALKWTVREMEERYRMMSQLGVRNVAGFNARVAEAARKGENLVRRVQTGFDDEGLPVFENQPLELEPLPFIVVVVDEMADLMLVAGKDIEAAIQRLSQMARAAGIHLIMATQRPSVDVITGTIKANFPSRISFQVTSKIDSRTILGEQGAEQLLGQGDMLYMATGGRVTRVHGPFVSDQEVEDVVRYLRQQGEPDYVPAVTEEEDDEGWAGLDASGGTGGDDLYREAVEMIAREGKASTSFVQRRLQIGYNRAARIIEQMEAEGLVSKPDRVGRREVLFGDGGG